MKDRSVAFMAISFLIALAFIGGLLLGAMITNRANEQIAALEESAESPLDLEAVEARAQSALDEIRTLYQGVSVLASFYGADHRGQPTREHGNVTSTGEIFDAWGYTAASRDLKPGTIALLELNGRYAIVRINDFGPARRLRHRKIDLAYAPARDLGMLEEGLAVVKMTVLWEPGKHPETMVMGRMAEGN